MLIRTHLAITLFFILLLLPVIDAKLVFVGVALLATFIPDIDSRFSTIGQKKIARLLQIFTKHRGMIHSFTFLLTITLVLVLFFPVVALGFFLGYASHLFADSFTKEGIAPFWPLKQRTSGFIRTGGYIETIFFVSLILIDILALLFLYFM